MTALERVKEARHLLNLVEEEARQHEDDYDFLWGIIQEAVYCQGVINTIVWRCNRVNNPGLQPPKEYEPVVHCKDCRHQRFYINDKESFHCDKSGVVNMHMEDGDGEFFCKYGERREKRAEQTEYKLPGHDEVMEALDKMTLRGDDND